MPAAVDSRLRGNDQRGGGNDGYAGSKGVGVALAREIVHGGLKNNREYLGDKVTADGVSPDELLPLYDPQTSGGLLVAVPGQQAPAFVRVLEGHATLAAVVGEVVEGQTITVVP